MSGVARLARPVIELRNVTKQYGEGRGAVRALADISLRIGAGELLAIAGPSAAGKTTLLDVIAGRCRPTTGTVTVLGHCLGHGDEDAHRSLLHGRLRMVSESTALIPTLSVLDALALQVSERSRSIEQARRAAFAALHAVGVHPRARAFVAELSSGERQRVAIAHALLARPEILLIDEPGRNLDWRAADGIVDLLRQACDLFGITVVQATQDIRIAAHAQRILSLVGGVVVDELWTQGAIE